MLRRGTTVIQSESYCRKKVERVEMKYNGVAQLCAVDAPTAKVSACQGDSGGPGIVTRADGVPVQVHGMDNDPFFAEEGGDIDAARDLVASTDQAKLFLYPGNVHLFADASLPGYDAAATTLMLGRVLDFLSALD